MKRDLELCRQILAEIERQSSPTVSSVAKQFNAEGMVGEDAKAYFEHVYLLADAGLVECTINKTLGLPRVSVASDLRLTWQGHEFLDQSRDPSAWEKVKTNGATWGWSGIKVFLAEIAKEAAKSAVRLVYHP